MGVLVEILVLLAVTASVIESQHFCTQRCTVTKSRSQRGRTSCGFWGWRRCTRYYRVYYSEVVTRRTCCSGWHGPNCDARWLEDPDCGRSIYPDAGEKLPPLTTIINGDAARRHEFPYQALITSSRGWCGGVLITKDWVLTAAHCVKKKLDSGTYTSLSEFTKTATIILGRHERSKSDVYQETRTASRAIVHENHECCEPLKDDIALIKLDRSAQRSDGRIRPICKPRRGNLHTGSTAIVSGWGGISRDKGDTQYASVLQYVPMKIISDGNCRRYWYLPPGFMCATDGGNLDSRGHCYGDSGGPLAVKGSDGRFRLVGVTSWASTPTRRHQCVAGTPLGYTRVTSYLDWIESHMN